jgi:F-type H+-transporting ATPase subunit b
MLFGAASVTTTTSTPNFLLPNGTFFVELVLFIIVLGTVAKFILPPIQRVIAERAARVRAAQETSGAGQHEAAELEAERIAVLETARSEARSALEQAARTVDQLLAEARARGQEAHDRDLAEARPRLEVERRNTLDALAGNLGPLVISAAERVLGGTIDGSRHADLIDAVADEARSSSAV